MIKLGINSTDLDTVAQKVGVALDLRFSRNDSTYRGGDYFRLEHPAGTLFIQHDLDVIDGEPFETTWPIGEVILYLDGPLDDDAWMEIVRLICGCLDIKATQIGART